MGGEPMQDLAAVATREGMRAPAAQRRHSAAPGIAAERGDRASVPSGARNTALLRTGPGLGIWPTVCGKGVVDA